MLELMDYQESIYSELQSTLHNKNHCVLVTCTGSGKTYLTLKFIIDEYHLLDNPNFSFNILVVAETLVILNAWKSHISSLSKFLPNIHLEVLTFISFNSNYKKCLKTPYSLVVFDEAHHCGAQSYRENIINFVNKHSSYKLGLTADPVRYSDKYRNVVNEIFNKNRVDGYSVLEAVYDGILPNFEYVMGLYNVYQNNKLLLGNTKINPKYLNHLKDCLSYHATLPILLKDYMLDGRRKGIIFCPDIKSMVDCEEIVKSAFPYANFYHIHSKQSKKETLSILKSFSDDSNDSYLLNVEMVNEGIHIDGVNTLIMFRKTSVPTVFYQQLGRVLSGRSKNYYHNHSTDIIVFDFTCNSNNITFLPNVIHKISPDELVENIYEMLNKRFNNKIIGDEPLSSFLSKIYSNPNIKNKPKKEINLILNNVIVLEIIQTLQLIDSSLKGLETWTSEEDAIIKKYYKKEKSNIVHRFNRRTYNAIKHRASELGVSSRPSWSDEEIKLLEYCDSHDIESLRHVQSIFDSFGYERSLGSIRLKRQERNLAKSSSETDWTDDELNFLRLNAKLGLSKLSECPELHRWNKEQIQNKCSHEGIRTSNRHQWTSDEAEFVLNNFGVLSPSELESYLNLSYDSIKSFHRRLLNGLKK